MKKIKKQNKKILELPDDTLIQMEVWELREFLDSVTNGAVSKIRKALTKRNE